MFKLCGFLALVYTIAAVVFTLVVSRDISDSYVKIENTPMCSDCCAYFIWVDNSTTEIINPIGTTYDCCLNVSNHIVNCPIEPDMNIIMLIVIWITYFIIACFIIDHSCGQTSESYEEVDSDEIQV